MSATDARSSAGHPGGVIGLDGRELAIARTALRHMKADLVGMRRLCEKVGDEQGRADYAARILELDIVRIKLGD